MVFPRTNGVVYARTDHSAVITDLSRSMKVFTSPLPKWCDEFKDGGFPASDSCGSFLDEKITMQSIKVGKPKCARTVLNENGDYRVKIRPFVNLKDKKVKLNNKLNNVK